MYKTRAIFFIAVCHCIPLVILFCYLCIAYKVDPLYLYNSPCIASSDIGLLSTDVPVILNPNMRLQAAGIANVYDFDSVVLGTSMLENTSSAYCDEKIGGNFVNVSISGGNYFERSIILNYFLNKKDIKNVIYSLDSYYIDCNKESFFDLNQWEYIYTGSKPSILKYLDISFMRTILGFHQCEGKKSTPDRPNAWLGSDDHMCRFGGIENWVANQDKQGVGEFLNATIPLAARQAAVKNRNFAHDLEREKKAKKYIDDNLLIFAEMFPATKFYLVFPPYWRYQFAYWRQIDPQAYHIHKTCVRYLVGRAQSLKNVYVFGFEDCEFVDHIENYKDVKHYHPRINEYITDSIAERKHLLTSSNIDAYLDRCEALSLKFDFQALEADVKKLLDEYKKK